MPKIKLSGLQKETLKFFGQNEFARNFYWTGGTLLSYCYLNHRDSIDLDFFSEDLFSDTEYVKFINDLKMAVKADKISFSMQNNRRLYLVQKGKEAIKLELVYFPFAAIEKRKKIKDFSVIADSLTDIMINKTLAAYQRDEIKDLYDLYFYLTDKPKYNLFQLISLIEKKFGVEIEPVIFLAKANETAGKLDSLKPLLMKKENNLSLNVKSFFQKLFNKKARTQLL